MRMAVKATGGPEAAAALRAVGREAFARTVIQQSFRPIARKMVLAARKNLRRNGSIRTGNLFRSVMVGILRRSRFMKGTYSGGLRVGQRRPGSAYAHLVEYGHNVVLTRRGQPETTRSGAVRRVRGKPFMGPAVDEYRDQVIPSFIQNFRPVLLKKAYQLGLRSGPRARGQQIRTSLR